MLGLGVWGVTWVVARLPWLKQAGGLGLAALLKRNKIFKAWLIQMLLLRSTPLKT
jgi:hypothetical protein